MEASGTSSRCSRFSASSGGLTPRLGRSLSRLPPPAQHLKVFGSRAWTRTRNLPVNSRLLYQLSYAGIAIFLKLRIIGFLVVLSSVPRPRFGHRVPVNLLDRMRRSAGSSPRPVPVTEFGQSHGAFEHRAELRTANDLQVTCVSSVGTKPS